MLSASRYILSGSPHNCAYCREPLHGEAHRRDNRYFCNELCADSAPKLAASTAFAAASSPRPALRPVLTVAA